MKRGIKEIIKEEGFLLYVLTDDVYLPSGVSKRDIERLKDIVKMCAEGGAKVFQYRAKKLDAGIQLKQAEIAREECERNKMLFFINDRVDIASLVGADGLHIGQEDIPPDKAKKLFDRFIGFSTHNIKQVKEAVERFGFISYISFGPIFPTATKKANQYPPTGLVSLKRAHEIAKSKFPIVAIGGINSENIKDIVRSGIRAVAVISFIFEGDIIRRCGEIIREAKLAIESAN